MEPKHESNPALTALDVGHPEYVGPHDKNYPAIKARADAEKWEREHPATEKRDVAPIDGPTEPAKTE